MDGFVKRSWIEHRGDRIDVNRLLINNVKPSRRIHPSVCYHHEDRREDTTHGDHNASQPMQYGWHPVPAIEIDPQEDRLSKEGESFQRKRHTDNPSGILHKLRPEQTQLERKDRTGHGSNRE